MLFTHINEISALIPTSKWKDISTLHPLLADEEMNVLLPIIGDNLSTYLTTQYNQLTTAGTGLPTSSTNADEQRTILLLRTCQSVCLYAMLSHNRALLSNSFNQGGGFNNMSAANYESADSQDHKDLDRELYANMHRKIELLLRQLEQDAQSPAPLYAEYWKQSTWFYYHADLIFTRAEMLQQFMDIDDSREKYVKLVPDIRYIQNTYLAPRVPLLKKLIASVSDEQVLRTIIRNSLTTQGYPTTTAITADMINAADAEVRDVLYQLRMAAGQYLRQRTERVQSKANYQYSVDYQSEGDLCMAQAEVLISTSNLFSPKAPADSTTGQSESTSVRHQFDNSKRDNAIFCFGSAVKY